MRRLAYYWTLASESLRRRGLRPTVLKALHAALDVLYDLGRELSCRSGTEGVVALEAVEVVGPNREHGSPYTPSGYRIIDAMFDALEPEFLRGAFIDFGSGKGRVLWLAAQRGFSRVIGVEFSSELCAEARKLLSRTGIRAEVFHADAAGFEIPPDAAVFYFFNPFDAVVLERVVANIARSCRDRPRQARALYVNAVHAEVFARHGFAAIKTFQTGGYESRLYGLAPRA